MNQRVKQAPVVDFSGENDDIFEGQRSHVCEFGQVSEAAISRLSIKGWIGNAAIPQLDNPHLRQQSRGEERTHHGLLVGAKRHALGTVFPPLVAEVLTHAVDRGYHFLLWK